MEIGIDTDVVNTKSIVQTAHPDCFILFVKQPITKRHTTVITQLPINSGLFILNHDFRVDTLFTRMAKRVT